MFSIVNTKTFNGFLKKVEMKSAKGNKTIPVTGRGIP
jgi:hypothetical protein